MTDRRQLEKDLALGEEWIARKKSDPLRLFVPTAKQQPFIDAVLRSSVYENWFVAANRSGKSAAGAYCGATLARFGVDPDRAAYSSGGAIAVSERATSGWVTSLDAPSSRDAIQPYYFDNGFVPASVTPFIPQREISEWRMSDQILKLKCGSIIGFKSSESGRLKFQGASKDWIHEDEEQPKDIHDESLIRVGSGRRLRYFGTCTLLPPIGQAGGVTWVYEHIIQKVLSGERTDIGLYGSSIYDNPHIAAEELRRLEATFTPGSTQARIRLDGEWLPGLSGARAYPSFDRKLHQRPQNEPNPRRPLCWFFDFNVSPMVSGVGQIDGKVFRVFRELFLEEGNVLEMVDWFRSVYPRHGAEIWVYGDSTGHGRDAGVGKSDYQLIANAMRTYPAPMRLKVPEVNPHVADRINAVNRLLKDEYGEVRVEIDTTCTELAADLEQVLRDVKGKILKTSNHRDPYFRRTHISDALGYWLAHCEPVKSIGLVPPPLRMAQPSYAFTR